MEDLFLFLSSNDSLEYYPDNKPACFSVKLPETMYLNGGGGMWMCALRDFQCRTSVVADLYLFCDMVEDSYVRNRKLPILQHIPRDFTTRQIVQTYDSSIHFPVTRQEINIITIHIKDEHLEFAPLVDQPSTCTLHFFRK